MRGPKMNGFLSIIRGCAWCASRPTPAGCRWLPAGQELSKLPSEYFREHQDDWVAFQCAEHAAQLRPEQRQAIPCGNVAELYRIHLSALQ